MCDSSQTNIRGSNSSDDVDESKINADLQSVNHQTKLNCVGSTNWNEKRDGESVTTLRDKIRHSLACKNPEKHKLEEQKLSAKQPQSIV